MLAGDTAATAPECKAVAYLCYAVSLLARLAQACLRPEASWWLHLGRESATILLL